MFSIDVDYSEFLSLINLPDQVSEALEEIGSTVATEAYAHAVQQAENKLHTRKDTYIQALSISQKDDAWILILDKSAMWIEEDSPSVDLKASLLSSPKTKQGKNGKYLIVPFGHSKASAGSSLTQTVQAELAQRNIPFSEIETHPNGDAKTGLLHRFDVSSGPNKTANVPGQGHGPIGKPMQGKTGTPFLQGLSVYQKQTKGEDGHSKTERFIGTFKTVSESSTGWLRGATEGTHIFDDVEEFILDKWDSEWSQKLSDKISMKVGQ